MKRVIVLGISGSIGKQTLKIIDDNPHLFELVGVSVNTNIDFLNTCLDNHPSIEVCSVGFKEDASKVHHKKVYFGEEGLDLLASYSKADIVVNALLGYVGLRPSLVALENDKDLAIANKEALVCGGELIKKALEKSRGKLYPIDSEHSAIYQCLVGEDKKKIKRLLITASGGPFYDLSLDDLKNVSKEQALKHPTWKMGNKITIDSATLVNKGLEIIEAHYLFDVPYQKITPVIQKESIIHSLVEFIDGSIKAQMGIPSMEVPILYALNGGQRTLKEDSYLPFDQAFDLHFRPLDLNRFYAVKIAYDVGSRGGIMPLAFSVSNEVIVKAFLDDVIAFCDIVPLIDAALKKVENRPLESLDDFKVTLKEVKDLAVHEIENWKGRAQL